TLSLHDALPISKVRNPVNGPFFNSPATPPTTRTVDPANPNAPLAVDPQNQAGGFFLVGPDGALANTRNNSINTNAPDSVPGSVPWYQTPGMHYTVTRTNGTWDPNLDDRNPGLTIALR